MRELHPHHKKGVYFFLTTQKLLPFRPWILKRLLIFTFRQLFSTILSARVQQHHEK